MSTQRLAEFLAAVSGFRDERSAIQGAAERAAEALEAEGRPAWPGTSCWPAAKAPSAG